MPPYQEKETKSINIVRFIRIEKDLFVGERIGVSHKDILRIDELGDRLENVLKTQPEEIDAGFISYSVDGILFVMDKSTSLDLPLLNHANKAREKSGIVFQEQSPNYKVMIKNTIYNS